MAPTNEDSAYSRLRSEILSLELVPGERLSERGLEAVLGASRTPIRAALMRLENEGLTRRRGRGWQVTPIDLTEVREAMEYREAIETEVVALAVERAEDDELDALLEIAEAHRDRDDEETGLRDGKSFHVALAHLARNRFLVDGMTDALTRLSRTRWLEVRSVEARAQARDEHVAIVTALAARDPEAAVARVRDHNRDTRDRLLATLTDERRRLRGRGFSIVESDAAVV
ncbi:MAG: GntR family transcriptional regulator [Actinobacteria bacterium]|nr:GntR family transcriptional regulator [Actinomycetota bacterium]